MKKLLVFDLDGTLVDSAGGIAVSVNRTRADYGFAPLSTEKIASFTGDGAKKLIERSFSDVRLPVPLEEAVEKMTRHYADDPVADSFLYDGVAEGIRELHNTGWIVTVVSNKPVIVSEKILTHFRLMPYLAENIGGGSGFPLKPAPDALFFLMEKYKVPAENIYVTGDNHTDLNFAKAAGVKSIFCEYGFGEKADAEASCTVSSFSECVKHLSAVLTEM